MCLSYYMYALCLLCYPVLPVVLVLLEGDRRWLEALQAAKPMQALAPAVRELLRKVLRLPRFQLHHH